MSIVIVSSAAKEVRNLIKARRFDEAFRVLRHKYSTYDRVWKMGRVAYPEVAKSLAEETIRKYPELALSVQKWQSQR